MTIMIIMKTTQGNVHARIGDRPTVPARNSFEEKQYDLVRRSVISIGHAQQNVERYRELRNASAARLLGGAA